MAYKTRLTFNSKDWQQPSGAYGKCPGTNNWECIAGFGFEEWYRNKDFQRDENGQIWQYGYWQCFKNPKTHPAGVYEDFTVYTRECPQGCTGDNQGKWYKVANYKKVVVLTADERNNAVTIFLNQLQQIRQTLQNMGVNVNNYFNGQPLSKITTGFECPKINIKFLIEDEEYIFHEKQPMLIKQGRARFGLYKENE